MGQKALIKLTLSLILAFLFMFGFIPLPIPRTGAQEKEPEINRSLVLWQFLSNYDSPLANKAGRLVAEADIAGIDWRLVAAISGVESTFGKYIPKNSYNAYGWNNGETKFASWEESIQIVSQTLGDKYYRRGLDTPFKIGPVYAPPSDTWAFKVQFFINKITETSLTSPSLTL